MRRVVYDSADSRAGEHARTFLAGLQSKLLRDGYSGTWVAASRASQKSDMLRTHTGSSLICTLITSAKTMVMDGPCGSSLLFKKVSMTLQCWMP
jgi:hypothetical protein